MFWKEYKTNIIYYNINNIIPKTDLKTWLSKTKAPIADVKWKGKYTLCKIITIDFFDKFMTAVASAFSNNSLSQHHSSVYCRM